jgi:purine-binding chemotaxis protein CheW
VLATFLAAERHFALEIGDVAEVVPMVALTVGLQAPEWIAGLLDLHGRMIPVVDLRARFGLASVEPTLGTPLLIVRSPTGPVGLIVDEVCDVVATERAAVTRTLPVEAGYGQAITDAPRIGDDLVLVLDPAWLVGVPPEEA